jgi:hypothetical protein
VYESKNMKFESSDRDETLSVDFSSFSGTAGQDDDTEYMNNKTPGQISEDDSISYSPSIATALTEERGHLSPRYPPSPEKKRNLVSPTKTKFFSDDIPSTESNVSEKSKTNHTSNRTAFAAQSKPKSASKKSTKTSKTAKATKASKHVPRILANHQRVPGGAAAKLIGLKNDDDYQFVNDGDDALEVLAPVDELDRIREKAKAEFSVGPSENKRYHAPVRKEIKDDAPRPRPRIVNRNEVFHEDPSSAVVSILTPSNKSSNAPDVEDILTARSSELQLSPKSGSTKYSSLLLRHGMKDDVASVKSAGSDAKSDANSAVSDAIETMTSTGKNPLVQHLMKRKTARHLAAIKNRMKDPTKNLTELMEGIASPTDGIFDRHYMVRRKNACGAIKVLAANSSHRINICWTVGVLPALASVLEDSGSDTLEKQYPNAIVRREFFEARKRALSALVYLATPKDNKLPMFHCPRLVAALVRVIEQDDGEARRSSCAVLAHLSKCKENRLIMAQVPGLLDAITTVIEPKDKCSGSEDSMSNHSAESDTSDVDNFHQTSTEEIEMSVSGNPTQTMSEEPVMSDDVAEFSARYDEDPDPFLHGARQNVFALLTHLVKEKDNTYILARHGYLITALVAVTKLQESISQDFGLKLLANLSRHRSNSKILVFKMKDVVPAIVFATHSKNDVSRKYACYSLQNFSQDKPCRQQLASIEGLLPAVCRCIRDAKDPVEKLAALHTLKNLTDEPANLIPMTNTPDCFATLIQVAHASDDSITEMMQYVGCDALSTLSHWFRSIATSGQRIGTLQLNRPENIGAKDTLFVPTQSVLAWEPWQ